FAGNESATDSGIYIQELGASQPPVLVLKSTLRAAWSPPGYLLFVRESVLFAQRMNPKSFQLEGEPIAITDEVTANADNGRAAFSISENGVLVYRRGLSRFRQLAWYARGGNRLGVIGKPVRFTTFSLSPDEKSAAMTMEGPSAGDTWIMDLNT